MPQVVETSRQAQFLIPAAISLGCGIMFATVITLLLALFPSSTQGIAHAHSLAD